MTDAAGEEEPLMTPADVAAWLGGDITEGTLSHWRHRGGGPEYVKAGHRVRYRPADVRAWLKSKGAEARQVPA